MKLSVAIDKKTHPMKPEFGWHPVGNSMRNPLLGFHFYIPETLVSKGPKSPEIVIVEAYFLEAVA